MHQIRFRLELRPRPRWVSLQRPSDPSWIWRPLRGRGGAGLVNRRERGGEVEGRERKGPKLLLNQCPSEPCYATAFMERRLRLMVVYMRAFLQWGQRFWSHVSIQTARYLYGISVRPSVRPSISLYVSPLNCGFFYNLFHQLIWPPFSFFKPNSVKYRQFMKIGLLNQSRTRPLSEKRVYLIEPC